MKNCASLLLLCLSSASISLAQDDTKVFERLTITNGLSQDNVLAILQDRKGYLWFGTYNGLNRYDGYSFTLFNYEPYDSTSISQHLILCLFEDHDGFIWVGTGGMGLCKFDPRTEKFTRYPVGTDSPKKLHHSTVTAIEEDREGVIWLGTVQGLSSFDKTTGIFTRYRHDPNDSSSVSTDGPVNAIFKDRRGNLWLGTGGNTINKIEFSRHLTGRPTVAGFKRYTLASSDKTSLASNHAVAFCEDGNGLLWIGTLQGLVALNPETRATKWYQRHGQDPNALSSDRINVRSLARDNQGNIWIGTVNGLNKFNPDRNTFEQFFHDPADAHSISNNDVNALIIDRSSTLWIGTVGGGVSKLDPAMRWFTAFRHDPHDQNSLSEDAVRALYEDRKGFVWIGTEGGGLNRFDCRSGSFTHYRYDQANANSLCSDFIGAITEDVNGNLWIGNGGSNFFSDATGGITIIDTAGKFRRLPGKDEYPARNPDVFTIYQDRKRDFWIGTEAGLRWLDAGGKLIRHFSPDFQTDTGLSDGWVYTVLEDAYGDIWIGTGSRALNRYDRKTNKFSHYRYDPSDPRSLTSNSVKSIYEDMSGNLWFGTSGGGLCRFERETENFFAVTTRDGLPDNTIYNMLEDDDGNLWLSTNSGISRFSPRDSTVINFDESDGLQSNQFASGYVNTGAAFKGRDGTLYFGGQHGFNMFHPRSITFNRHIPPVVITQFRLFDKPDPLRKNAETIRLSYDENFFSFEFAALNYTNSQKNRYAYQMENFDPDWIQSGSRRYVSYTNLDPGEYFFRVKGSNNDGVWNNDGATVRVIILPPWWRTWWAYLLYAVGIVTCLIGTYYYVVSRERLRTALEMQKVEAAKMHELDHMKSQFFANISHEFRTPLALILGPVEQLMKQDASATRHDIYKIIERNARRLLRLINQLLDLSKLESGSLTSDQRQGNIADFLRAMTDSFAAYALNKKISFTYNIPASPDIAQYDADNLEKIITNLLSNAFKFTPPGGEVRFDAMIHRASLSSPAELRVSVADNGIGIPMEEQQKVFDRFYQVANNRKVPAEGTGIGLALTRELVNLLGGKLTVSSTEKMGSTFEVVLPLRLVATTETESATTLMKEPIQPDTGFPESAAPAGENAGDDNRAVALVVEDSDDLRHFISELLSPDFRVIASADAQQGLHMATRLIPDIIVTDIMIPGMDGIELCRKLKEDQCTSHIPVVVLTAKATLDSKLEGLRSGADDYLTKPFTASELLARIGNLVTQRKKLRKLFSSKIRLEPTGVSVTPVDSKFLVKAIAIVEEHMADAEFSVETFAREIGMSRAQLYRKLMALTDQSPADLIKTIRIKRASDLLRQNFGNIAEVSFATGFNDPSYFARCFRETMGLSPKDYVATHAQEQKS